MVFDLSLNRQLSPVYFSCLNLIILKGVRVFERKWEKYKVKEWNMSGKNSQKMRWILIGPRMWGNTPHTATHALVLVARSKMASLITFSILLALFTSQSFANKVEDEDQCRTYAGGQVYPERTRIPEHAMHWSKARSEFENPRVTLCLV